MPIPLYYFILLELVTVSFVDIKNKKISNFWPLLNICMFPVLCWLFSKYYYLSWTAFIFPGAFLFVGFILYLLKIMGGGDTKFLFSFFLIIPIQLHEQMFELLLLATLIIGSFVLITNLTNNIKKILLSLETHQYNEVKKFFGTKFSYAPVVLIAWIWLGFQNKVFVFH